MIAIEIRRKDLKEIARIDVHNLPGTLFAGSNPLLKPFMKKLEALLPPDTEERSDSYIFSALHSRIDRVLADVNRILVASGETIVYINRDELNNIMDERYPTTDHQKLNLPGLLFLQSSPALQTTFAAMLRRDHFLQVPDGRRTLRYIFHIGVVSIDADKEEIRVMFDTNKLPKKINGSSILEKI